MSERLPNDILNDLVNLAAHRAMDDVYATYQLIDDPSQRHDLIATIALCFFGIAIRTFQMTDKHQMFTDDVVARSLAAGLVEVVEKAPPPPAGRWAQP